MNASPDTKTLTFRLPADLHRQLTTVAKREQRSLHAQLLYALAQWLKEHNNNAA